jgi:hypothetical protein
VLLAGCRSFVQNVGHALAVKEGAEKARDKRQRLLADALALLTFQYYAATAMEIFDDEPLRAPCGDHQYPSAEVLTSARRAFGVNARIAWDLVILARSGMELEAVAFPGL